MEKIIFGLPLLFCILGQKVSTSLMNPQNNKKTVFSAKFIDIYYII